jgi:hypothetical protein
MSRSTRLLVASLTIAVCLWPAAAATAHDAPPSDATLTVDQVRGAFASAGFQVDVAHHWDWTSPPVSTFQIHDPANGRVLMALVYPSSGAAQTGRLQALAREQEDNPGSITLSGHGPHLVPGFGRSAWRGNVALVQTTQSELDRMHRLQNDCDPGLLVVDTNVLRESSPPSAVDYDFQQALASSAVSV